jgi:hypothetical protein
MLARTPIFMTRAQRGPLVSGHVPARRMPHSGSAAVAVMKSTHFLFKTDVNPS